MTHTEGKPYKYDCRTCSIRQQCIDEKHLAPGVKIIIACSFEQHTDTDELWELVQRDCLRVKQEAAADKPPGESALSQRLRLARQPAQPPDKSAEVTGSPPLSAEPSTEPGFEAASFETMASVQADWGSISFETIEAEAVRPSSEPAAPEAREAVFQVLPVQRACGFVSATGRLIRLPIEGAVVLGRSEYGQGSLPDIDLFYDQGGVPSVSRHHACLTGKNGRHWIEDLGSANGTWVNQARLRQGERVQLTPHDVVVLGRCRLVYSPLPAHVLSPRVDPRARYGLLATHTGQLIALPNKSEIMLGRPDPQFRYIPDVDLCVAGEIGRHVSRRHALLLLRGGRYWIQDAGSAAGTRLNGRAIRFGDPPAGLQLGDQVWLGGCVVSLEVITRAA